MNDHVCKYEDKIERMSTQIDNVENKINVMYEAQVGTPNGSKRGNNTRLEIIERWKRVVNWAVATLYVALLTAATTWAVTKIGG